MVELVMIPQEDDRVLWLGYMQDGESYSAKFVLTED